MRFTHLQVTSGYSLMQSTMTVERLVSAANANQFDALALTDWHVLHGAVHFYRMCQQYNIKPIVGMTVQIQEDNGDNTSCIILAKTNTGYESLIQLSTVYQQETNMPMTKEKLGAYLNDVIVILPATNPIMTQLLQDSTFSQVDTYVNQWRSILSKGDFYIGVEDHGTDIERHIQSVLKAYSEFSSIPVVAVNDVRYIRHKDVLAYDCLQAIKAGERWEPGRDMRTVKERHLRTSEEMERLFVDWPDVLDNTQTIADQCNVTFHFDQLKLPAFPVPYDMTAHAYLQMLCRENLSYKYDSVNKTAADRLEHELDVIENMGFSDYFLIVHDFVDYAKQQGIMVGPGRGSAAGSIVAYVLGITDVDPIRYNLLFERFLNPERVSMPDIDIDFSDTRRDEVIEYVRNKYGNDHVAQIITFGTFAPRSLLRELIKTMGVDQQDAYYILQQIPNQTSRSITEHINDSQDFKTYIKSSSKLKTMFAVASVLEGLPRHASTHAAGVIISHQPLTDHVPLIPGSDNMWLTQYEMGDLENLGMLKMDFLGLRNLTLIERIIRTIRYTTDVNIDLQTIPQNDPAAFELLQLGLTNGVFQLESKGMKNVLMQLKPTDFEDIVAVNALYRPGPMDNIPTYIARKHGQERPQYPHPNVESILAPTYGVLVYQEQIMLVAHEMAGFSLGEADVLRRAVSKKQRQLMDRQHDQFIKRSIAGGYSQTAAQEMFDWIVQFSNYGFNRSHAVAYSMISYQLAYLKAHYPFAFFAELLSSTSNQEDKIHMYINEAKQQNITIYQPSINKSYGRFSVEKSGIRMGLLSVKGMGHNVVGDILDQRKKNGVFNDLFDFCLRVPAKIANRKTLENLILAGVFDELHDNRASLLATIDQAMEQGELFREFQDKPGLFDNQVGFESIYTEIADFSQLKKLADEKELLGIYVSSHPLQTHRQVLKHNGYMTLAQVYARSDKNFVEGAAIIETLKTIRTKRGDPMAFLTLSDETAEMEAVVFPDLYREVGRWLFEEKMIRYKGKTETRNNKRQVILTDMTDFEDTTLQNPETIYIKLVDQTSEEALSRMKQIAKRHPGHAPVIVYHQAYHKTYRLSRQYFMEPDESSLNALKHYFGEDHVVFRK